MGETIESFEPWFYEFDLGAAGRTTSKLPPEVLPIHETRLRMVNSAVRAAFSPDDMSKLDCLDVGCHEGYYAVELAKLGVRSVLGVDVREDSLQKARFVARAMALTNVTFEVSDAEELATRTPGPFDLTLALGLLYHVENPMRCLRNISAVTGRAAVIETQVIEEVEGRTEWGARQWTQPYQGVLALIDESAQFAQGNPEAGATPLASCPSPKALQTMLLHAGFRAVKFIDPPQDAYEQLARGKRVVCLALK